LAQKVKMQDNPEYSIGLIYSFDHSSSIIRFSLCL